MLFIPFDILVKYSDAMDIIPTEAFIVYFCPTGVDWMVSGVVHVCKVKHWAVFITVRIA